MEIFVYSLRGILYHGRVKSIHCKTVAGEITVLDRHEALITALAHGVLRVVDDQEKEHYFNINSGFLEITPFNEAHCILS